MAYSVNVVRQDGFQLPSPAHTASPSDTAIDSPLPHPQAHTPTQNHTPPAASSSSDLFMPHNISFLPDSFRKFPSAAAVHSPHPNGSSNSGNNGGGNGVVDFSDELAGLIAPEHERGDPYRHNIFDISAPASAAHTHGMYQPPAQGQSPHDLHHQPTHAHFNSTLPALNSSMRYEPHPDPPQSQQGFSGYRHTPSPHGSRSRSRSVGPTRNGRRERRANSISSQSQAGASPPPQHQRPHPHAILIPGRSSSLGNSGWYGAYLPPGTGGEYGRGDYNGASARGPGGEYNLPTPESLTHSFGAFGPGQEYNGNGGGGGNNGWYAQAQGRVDTPGAGGMGVSPSQVSTMSPHVSSLGMHHLHNPNPNPHNPNHISHSLSHSLPLPLHPSIANAKYHHTHGHSLKSPTSPTSPTSPGSPSPPDSLLSPISSSLTATSPIANGLTPTTSTNGANASAGGASAGTTNPSGNTLSEKRRRRRESHNAVERRRRDNINERIGELAGLIPGVLFECDAPLVVPSATSSSNTSNTNATSTSSTNPNTTNGNPQNPEELFALLPDGLGINDAISMSFGSSFGMGMNFGDMGVLPELPEEGMNMGMNIGMDMMGMGGVKADPSEDGHPSGNGNTTGGTGVGNGTGMGAGNGTAEPQTIKANKGMILRKSVEYIRYLQQLVGVQASRGRELEERNRVLERELVAVRQAQNHGQVQAQNQAQVSQASPQGQNQGQSQNQLQEKGQPIAQNSLAVRRHARKLSRSKVYELESMPEDEMEIEVDAKITDKEALDRIGGGEANGDEEGEEKPLMDAERGRRTLRGRAGKRARSGDAEDPKLDHEHSHAHPHEDGDANAHENGDDGEDDVAEEGESRTRGRERARGRGLKRALKLSYSQERDEDGSVSMSLSVSRERLGLEDGEDEDGMDI